MAGLHIGFGLFLRSARSALAEREGADFAGEVVAAAREEYERVLPLVPDIGGRANVFQPVMTINGWIVALHRALLASGKQAADTVAVCHVVFDGWLRMLPGFVLRGMGRLAFSGPAQRYFERQAARSQERRRPDDFVWQVERGPDGELAMVFDECAVNKWYDAHGLPELKPYCNFFDVTYSRLMGMGVDPSETIGLGCERCALRFKHGRETTVPPPLEGVIGTAWSPSVQSPD